MLRDSEGAFSRPGRGIDRLRREADFSQLGDWDTLCEAASARWLRQACLARLVGCSGSSSSSSSSSSPSLVDWPLGLGGLDAEEGGFLLEGSDLQLSRILYALQCHYEVAECDVAVDVGATEGVPEDYGTSEIVLP